jgi:hypothetical protein
MNDTAVAIGLSAHLAFGMAAMPIFVILELKNNLYNPNKLVKIKQ